MLCKRVFSTPTLYVRSSAQQFPSYRSAPYDDMLQFVFRRTSSALFCGVLLPSPRLAAQYFFSGKELPGHPVFHVKTNVERGAILPLHIFEVN